MFDISKIYTLICQLKAIGNYAYDIHYSANGKEFYSEHLLSERVAGDSSYIVDDVIETIYLGRGIDAPLSEDITATVSEMIPEVTEDAQTNFKRLRDLIVNALVGIEELDGLTRGEEDLIGSIAHALQRNNGLLFRQLDYAVDELENDKEEDVDWITVKGSRIPIPKGASEKEI